MTLPTNHTQRRSFRQSGHVTVTRALLLAAALGVLPALFALGGSTQEAIEGRAVASSRVAAATPRVRSTSSAGMLGRLTQLARTTASSTAQSTASGLRRLADRLSPLSAEASKATTPAKSATETARTQDILRTVKSLKSTVAYRQLLQQIGEQKSLGVRSSQFQLFHGLVNQLENSHAYKESALTLIREFPDPQLRSRLLAQFAKAEDSLPHWKEALGNAGEIDYLHGRTDALGEIAELQPRESVWRDLLTAMEQLPEDYQPILRRHFANSDPPEEVLQELVDAAHAIDKPHVRFDALLELAVARGTDMQRWLNALEASREIVLGARGHYLSEFANASPPGAILPPLLDEILKLDDANRLTPTLSRLVKKGLPESLLNRVIEAANGSTDFKGRAHLFANIAERHDARYWHDAIQALKRIPDSKVQIDTLANFAERVPDELRPQLLEMTRGIERPESKLDVLLAFTKRGNDLEVWDAVIDAAGELDDSPLAQALTDIVYKAPPEQVWPDLLSHVDRLPGLRRTHMLDTVADRANKLNVSDDTWRDLISLIDGIEDQSAKIDARARFEYHVPPHLLSELRKP